MKDFKLKYSYITLFIGSMFLYMNSFASYNNENYDVCSLEFKPVCGYNANYKGEILSYETYPNECIFYELDGKKYYDNLLNGDCEDLKNTYNPIILENSIPPTPNVDYPYTPYPPTPNVDYPYTPYPPTPNIDYPYTPIPIFDQNESFCSLNYKPVCGYNTDILGNITSYKTYSNECNYYTQDGAYYYEIMSYGACEESSINLPDKENVCRIDYPIIINFLSTTEIERDPFKYFEILDKKTEYDYMCLDYNQFSTMEIPRF